MKRYKRFEETKDIIRDITILRNGKFYVNINPSYEGAYYNVLNGQKNLNIFIEYMKNIGDKQKEFKFEMSYPYSDNYKFEYDRIKKVCKLLNLKIIKTIEPTEDNSGFYFFTRSI